MVTKSGGGAMIEATKHSIIYNNGQAAGLLCPNVWRGLMKNALGNEASEVDGIGREPNR